MNSHSVSLVPPAPPQAAEPIRGRPSAAEPQPNSSRQDIGHKKARKGNACVRRSLIFFALLYRKILASHEKFHPKFGRKKTQEAQEGNQHIQARRLGFPVGIFLRILGLFAAIRIQVFLWLRLSRALPLCGQKIFAACVHFQTLQGKAVQCAVLVWAIVSAGAGVVHAENTPPKSPEIVSVTASFVPPEMRLESLPMRAPEPKDNPTTPAKIALGRLLFFDPILSATRDVSCATCHHPRFGWTDGRAAPIGVGGAGLGPERMFRTPSLLAPLKRNVPTILNVGFNGLVAGATPDPAKAPMFWDSREQSLERQLFSPIQSREEMHGDGFAESEAVDQAISRVRSIGEYRELFSAAFGQPAGKVVTTGHLAQAIAAFERSLVTPRTAFDRFMGGDALALDTEQQRGLRIFQDAGCTQCHGGPMFSDFKLHVVATPDSTPGGQRDFRTPTLRNLRHTAPYMHNGSFRTLRDVLVFYEALADAVSEMLDGGDTETQPRLDPLLKELNLNAEDFPALEAFFDALNDDNYDQTAPAKVPSGLPVIQ